MYLQEYKFYREDIKNYLILKSLLAYTIVDTRLFDLWTKTIYKAGVHEEFYIVLTAIVQLFSALSVDINKEN